MPLSEEQLDKIENKLPAADKLMYDKAMEFANNYQYDDAISSYESDCFARNHMYRNIARSCLEYYTKSPEDFREGLLSLYSHLLVDNTKF